MYLIKNLSFNAKKKFKSCNKNNFIMIILINICIILELKPKKNMFYLNFLKF